MNKTLVIVDAQKDFIAPKGILTFDNGKGDEVLIKKINDFVGNISKSNFANAIVTQDTHNVLDYPDSEEAKLFPLHCHWNTPGWCLVFDNTVLENKVKNIQYLYKDKFDMWNNDLATPDEKILNKSDEVVLMGVASDFCVEKALAGFVDRGFKVTILKDLTRGINKEIQDVIMQNDVYKNAMKNGQIKLTNSTEYLKKSNDKMFLLNAKNKER